ncbi:DUF4349 domain-containing protein [Bacillus alkalicellulosilyticus]|uniref:DUF4349 domain-containing protein n=1 Tax=Alkalihalobacterium alkalicellulosilyticum TaxID=1912214 RepID=UPI00099820BE|nr:DUF4349 domain-containing protein [Bacillus alkalicellulosilyticus]
MKTSKIGSMLFLVILLFLSGCGGSYDEATESPSMGYDMAEEAAMDTQAEYDFALANKFEGEGAVDDVEFQERQLAEPAEPSTLATERVSASERMVIYNAFLSLEVKSYQKMTEQIREKVSAVGGYVVESNVYNHGEGDIYGRMVVKVPQKSFDPLLTEIETNSIKVEERTVSGQDVTEEYVDLESRLRSKEAVEKRLLSFMEEAEKTEDLLKISNDLGRVQEEIEQLKGRMKYLENNVSFSTISMDLHERQVNVASIQDTENLNTWVKAKSLFMDSVNGIISLFSSLVILAIGLSPVFLPILFVAFFITVFIRKKKAKNISTNE